VPCENVTKEWWDRQSSAAGSGLGFFNVPGVALHLFKCPDDMNESLEEVEVLAFESDQLAPTAAEIYSRVEKWLEQNVDVLNEQLNLLRLEIELFAMFDARQ
jgi:hypothetical protein